MNFDLAIPNWAERVKLDVGTSCNAPFTEHWTNQEDNCFVIAFEPNPFNIEDIRSEAGKMWPIWLKSEKIGEVCHIFECALSNEPGQAEFYCAAQDGGTSSLYRPKNIIDIKKVISVEKTTLSQFFDSFDWQRFPYIEHLKIDAQSSDYEILLGAGDYLDRIVYIDIETHTNGQYFHDEDPNKILRLLIDKGFECLEFGINSTFVNSKLKNLGVKYFTLKE
jgi:FkbM family methyltransferase